MDAIVSKNKLNNSRKKELIFTLSMVALPMIQFVIFWGYVSFDSILMAFRDGQGNWGFANFERFFKDSPQNITSIVNSLINLGVAQLITLPLVVILAYFLFKRCYGANVFRVLFFLPSLIGSVVMAYLFISLVSPNGALDHGPVITLLEKMGVRVSEDVLDRGLLGVPNKTAFLTVEFYTVWTGVGTNLVLLCGGLARAPQDLFEAAKIDGAGMWKEFTVIVVPILWSTITTLFIFNLAGCFTMYLPVMLMTPNNGEAMTIGYYIIKHTNDSSVSALGYPAAVGLIFTVIIVPVILFVKWIFGKISEAMEF